MDENRNESLAGELRASALLFGLAICSTAGAVGFTQLLLRALS